MLLVRFSNFWNGFNPQNNLFIKVLEEICEKEIKVINNPLINVDLQISSVFQSKKTIEKIIKILNSSFDGFKNHESRNRYVYGFANPKSFNANKKVWFTGENLRPPFAKYDGTLTFESTDNLTNNLYFPYWMYRLDWGYDSHEFEIMPLPSSLTKSRNPMKRSLSACSFSSFREPERMKIDSAVSQVIQLDKFGRAYNKYVKEKLPLSSNYGFQVVSENSKYPNYVTEKLQEAWVSRNVPIWSGLNFDDIFNKESFVDVTYLSYSEIIEKIGSIDFDEMMYIQSRPLLNFEPSIEPLKEFFLNLI